MEACASEAVKYVWEGAIPLQIHLHESEVTTLPPPPPALILGPRVGYLPLLIPLIKPYFDGALPPGVDAVWFEYKGLPLKWYIPTGVLFDLLCTEPERPWNLTVHFRGYPEILTPCEGEDSVKWSFINSLKEAAYIINGNCKNVMNMSQADQLELWQSVVKGNIESYSRASSKLKLGPLGKDCLLKRTSSQIKSATETNSNQTGKVPVRLYIRRVAEDLDDLEDATPVDNWDMISYLNRPIEIYKEEGNTLTLKTAIESLLPDFFDDVASHEDSTMGTEESISAVPSVEITEASNVRSDSEPQQASAELTSRLSVTPKIRSAELTSRLSVKPKIKLIRIQGIEPGLDVPLYWIVNNLVNPEHFLHICVLVSSSNTM